jgi:DNA-binding PucR family transcriptional regulator
VTDLRRDSAFDVDACTTEIAARLSGRLPELASNVRLFIEDAVPQMRGDALLMELFRASVESNLDTLLSAVRYHIALERVAAPTAAMEHARRLAQHGVPVNALVRSYRLGQGRMNELVFDAVRTADVPPLARVAILERITATLFQYVDRISQQVIDVYEEEHERWLENQNSIRVLRVRELLAGKKAIDVDAATTSVRYPLRWHHVAVVMWYPDSRADEDLLPQMQRFLVELGQTACAEANPLFVAADRITCWGWLPYKAAMHGASEDTRAKIRTLMAGRSDSPSLGIGNSAPGIEGFRRSHQQAQRARSVAIARHQPGPTLIFAAEPGLSLAALLAADISEARDWVADALGDLAGDDENDERMRETLRVFLRCGSSYKLAAEELSLHFNTVRYRVGRAITRLGRSIDDDRLDVEVALLLCQWFGPTVLQTPR